MKPVALIPARAGSERIPRKNLMTVMGRPLVGIASDQAVKCGVFADGDVWVSTDFPADMMRANTAEGTQICARPDFLCGSDAKMIDVVRYFWRSEYASNPDVAVVLLQPTSPLRLPEDISRAWELFLSTGSDALVSVVEPRNQDMFTIGHSGRLRPVFMGQDGRHFVLPNGAIYIISGNMLEHHRDWWSAQVAVGYEMPPSRSIDIDTEDDLDVARLLWKR